MDKYRCFVGHYDGKREGLIIAKSQQQAASVVGCSLYTIREYWKVGHDLHLGLKVLTVYTRPYGSTSIPRGAWKEGVCEVGRPQQT